MTFKGLWEATKFVAVVSAVTALAACGYYLDHLRFTL